MSSILLDILYNEIVYIQRENNSILVPILGTSKFQEVIVSIAYKIQTKYGDELFLYCPIDNKEFRLNIWDIKRSRYISLDFEYEKHSRLIEYLKMFSI